MGGGEVKTAIKFSKRGCLTGSQFLEGVAGREGVIFFGKGGVHFLLKK